MFSFRKKELVISRKNYKYNNTFLQPWAVAIVSAILVSLILGMGFFELKRSESNLVGFMEDQALSTVGVLQRLTEENLKSITAATDKSGSPARTASQEEASYSKRWVVEAITEFGREIDRDWKKGKVNNNYLRQLAQDNKLWYLAVVNRQGQAVYQSRKLQTNMLEKEDLVKDGRRLTTIELIEKIRAKKGIGFVALRRKDNSGTVVINLDKPGLIYWSLKVAAERGIKKIGEGHGIIYLQLIDEHNKVLSGIGQLTAGLTNSDFNYRDVLSGKVRILSRKVDATESKILDMAAPCMSIKRSLTLSVSVSIAVPWIKLSQRTARTSLSSWPLSPGWRSCPCGCFIMIRTGILPASSKWSGGWRKRSVFPPWDSLPPAWRTRFATP